MSAVWDFLNLVYGQPWRHGSRTDNVCDLGQVVVENAGLKGALRQIRTQAVAENAGLEEEVLLMRIQAQVVKAGLERQLLLVKTRAAVENASLEEAL